MAYQTAEIKTFSGLFLQPNSLSVPDGAMERAMNVVISDDNVISKVRGVYRYYDPGSDEINSLHVYQDKLVGVFTTKLAHFADTGSAPNITGTITNLSGEQVSITGTRRSRSLEQSGNFYFTTDRGVLKIDSLSGKIFKAGIPPALDLRGVFDAANGILSAPVYTAGSPSTLGTSWSVGYRVVFGRTDANDNVLLGAPSDILVLSNITRSGVSYTSAGAGPYTVTVTDPGHNLATGMVISVANASDPDAEGASFAVTVTSLTQFTYSTTNNPASGTLDYAATRKPILEFSLPSEISAATDKYFFQVYRTSQAATDPFPDFRLIAQEFVTAAQITADVIFYSDVIDDVLLTSAPYLYTNPNSREGELQANTRPPLCADMVLFREMVLYANCTYAAILDLDVIDTSVMANNDTFRTLVIIAEDAAYTSVGAGPYTVTVTSIAHGLSVGQVILVTAATDPDAVSAFVVATASANAFTFSAVGDPSSGVMTFGLLRVYLGLTGVGNTNVIAEGASNVGALISVTYTAHGLATGDTIYVSNAKGTGTLPDGSYVITVTGANTFDFTAGAVPTTITNLNFQGVNRGTSYLYSIDKASASAATRLRNTARGLVKALNRDPNSLIYGNYASGITDTPGKMRFSAKGFTRTISCTVNPVAATEGFSRTLPTSFTAGDQVASIGEDQPNVIAVSKIGEPEAVPLVNQVTVGSRNKDLFRVLALRDSVLVWKNDGVFRINGQSPDTLIATPLDTTVFLVAQDSLVLINNSGYGLTNQGVVSASDNAVQIISRRIENVIEPIVGLDTIAAQTAAVGYESDRSYRLSTIGPNDTSKTITYLYSTINDTWTQSDSLFVNGVVGPKNVLYQVRDDGVLMRERKYGNRYDFTGQNFTATVVSVASDGMSGVITVVGANPEAGDVIVKSDVVTRIRAVAQSGSDWAVTFYATTNLVAADSVQLYSRIVSECRMAPFHAGMVGRTKQFAQIQIHQRQSAITRLSVQFASNYFGGSEITEWLKTLVASTSGWGNEPWGFFPWGLADGIANIYQSQAAPILRLWVPKFAQRCAWIQPVITHEEAGEDMQIQALSWSVRAYAERTTK